MKQKRTKKCRAKIKRRIIQMKETPTQSQNAGKLCMQNVELYLTFECLFEKKKKLAALRSIYFSKDFFAQASSSHHHRRHEILTCCSRNTFSIDTLTIGCALLMLLLLAESVWKSALISTPTSPAVLESL